MHVPVHHHCGELPVAYHVRLLVRLLHAVRDELQLLEDQVQLARIAAARVLLDGGRPTEAKRSQPLFGLVRVGRGWLDEKRFVVVFLFLFSVIRERKGAMIAEREKEWYEQKRVSNDRDDECRLIFSMRAGKLEVADSVNLFSLNNLRMLR